MTDGGSPTLVPNVHDTFQGYVSPALLEPVLCYVTESFAYFTTLPLTEQNGPAWDRPYTFGDATEKIPYSPSLPKDFYQGIPSAPLWSITKMAYDGEWWLPDETVDIAPGASVYDINRQAVPWLRSMDEDGEDESKVIIWAGAMIPEFMEMVEAAGGRCYPHMPYGAVRAARGI